MVDSTTVATRLNADLLDGNEAAAFQQRVTGSCGAGTYVTGVNAIGTVNCGTPSSSVPAGIIVAAGNTAAPTGFLYCDGSAVSRATYSDLFAAIGTAYGMGDGATTFNVPDLRGYFLRGQNDGAGIDPDALARTALGAGGNSGDAVGSKQDDGTAVNSLAVSADGVHFHQRREGNTYAGGPNNEAGSWYGAPWVYNVTSTDGSHTHAMTGDNETRPANVYVRFYIKY